MNILVTGGAGFIGRKAAHQLSTKHTVDIIDFEEKITEDLRESFTCYGIDISKKGWIEQHPKNYDIIVHCAAQTGGYYSLKDPTKDCEWNCLGTINVVELAKKCKGLRKIVYTSSMAVYGEGLHKSEMSQLQPISYYGVSKLAGEFYIKLCWEHVGVPYTILRLWNTYGAGQDLTNEHQGMLSIYLSQALQDDVIKMTGSKDRVRDFIHVDDVVSAIDICVRDRRTDNEVFNVCSGMQHTSEDVVIEISRQMQKDLSIKEIEGYIGDQSTSSGTNDKLSNLGWSVTANLSDGVSEFLKNL